MTTDSLAILQNVSQLEPNFKNYEVEKIETDRLTDLATAQLKSCDGLDLLTTVWRGRIILSLKTLLQERSAEGSYYTWLDKNGIGEDKADALIATANRADRLIEDKHLSLKGIANIDSKAFEIVSSNTTALVLAAKAAEGGATVTLNTAKRLVDEQTVAQAQLLGERTKEKVLDGLLPSSMVAKLTRELEKLKDRTTGISEDDTGIVADIKARHTEVTNELEENCDIDTLKVCTKESQALNKFLDRLEEVSNLKSIDPQKLLTEAARLEVTPLIATIVTTLGDLETAAIRYEKKLSKLIDSCDRLYVESSSGDRESRQLAELFGTGLKRLSVPVGNNSNKIIEIMCKVVEQTPDNFD